MEEMAARQGEHSLPFLTIHQEVKAVGQPSPRFLLEDAETTFTMPPFHTNGLLYVDAKHCRILVLKLVINTV